MTARHSEVIRHARVWNERRDPRVAREVAPARNGKFFPGLMDWLALSSALGWGCSLKSWSGSTSANALRGNHVSFANPARSSATCTPTTPGSQAPSPPKMPP
jgi:hypothetical protein